MLCPLRQKLKTSWIATAAPLHINTSSLHLMVMRLCVNLLLAVGWCRSSRQLTIQRKLSVFVDNSTCVSLLCGLSCAGDVPVSTHSEGNSLWDTRPRQSPSAHTLGTDGLRCAVHIFTEIPHDLSNCSVSTLAAYIETLSAVLGCLLFLFHYDGYIGM